ncbi:MAG: hypothetical protein WAS90_11325 [Brachymonas denitrificans]
MTGMMVSMDDELINAVEHFGAEVVQNMNEIEALRAQVRTLFSLIYAMNNETKGVMALELNRQKAIFTNACSDPQDALALDSLMSEENAEVIESVEQFANIIQNRDE